MMSQLKENLDQEESGKLRRRGLNQGPAMQQNNDVQSYEIFFPGLLRDEYDRHFMQRNSYYHKEHDDFEAQRKMQL